MSFFVSVSIVHLCLAQNVWFLRSKLQNTSKNVHALFYTIFEVKFLSYSKSDITSQLCFHESRGPGVIKDLFLFFILSYVLQKLQNNQVNIL